MADGEPKKKAVTVHENQSVVVCGSLQDCRSNHLFCGGMCKGLDLGWLMFGLGWCL